MRTVAYKMHIIAHYLIALMFLSDAMNRNAQLPTWQINANNGLLRQTSENISEI
jgi:hypothetical protein